MNNAPAQNPQEDDNQTAVVQLLAALIAANTVGYPRLQAHLQAVVDAIHSGKQKLVQEQVASLVTFVQSYRPIDKKNLEFLRQYGEANAQLLSQLQQMVGAPTTPKPKALQPALKPKLNVKKHGLYRFPFLSHEKLDLGDITQYKTIPQDMNANGLHYKLWKDINGIPFLVSGYKDDAYSCVTRVLASQAAKLLGLNCEEVFFGSFNGKPVTLTCFNEAVTLLENETFKFYPMAANYEYQSEQKRAFYFLIQHWTAYAVVSKGQIKERFERHFVDASGNVFLSQHEFATFLTPQQMSPALMVRLTLTSENYRAIRDLTIRVGDMDISDIVFSSIPQDMIEAHDQAASALNKPTFDQRRDAFEANWVRLQQCLEQLEQGNPM